MEADLRNGRKLLRALRAQGFSYTRMKSGYMVHAPDRRRKYMVHLSSLNGRRRAYSNMLNGLEAIGFRDPAEWRLERRARKEAQMTAEVETPTEEATVTQAVEDIISQAKDEVDIGVPVCDVCGFEPVGKNTKIALAVHKRRAHGIQGVFAQKNAPEKQKPEKQKKQKPEKKQQTEKQTEKAASCEYCGFVAKSGRGIRMHVARSHAAEPVILIDRITRDLALLRSALSSSDPVKLKAENAALREKLGRITKALA